jgi:threonine dehydratase
MPSFAPLRKITQTKRLGAEVILVNGGFDDAMAHAKKVAKENDMTFIHAFDDPYIIAGQGTIGLEILREHPDIDTIVVPIGGGGMIAGIALAAKHINKDIKVIGVEPVRAASMQNSLTLGLPTMLEKIVTIADGVAVGMPGNLAFDVCKKYLDDIIVVTEDEIAGAILYLMEEGKMVVEGAGAVAFAAILAGKIQTENKKVATVVSGGNIDVSMLARIIDQGLIKHGRKTTISTIVPDRPGNLSHVVSTVSKLGGNILEIQHERSQLDIEIDQVRINIKFESRDHDHIKEIIAELDKIGHSVKEING